jgi:hypothetical protein
MKKFFLVAFCVLFAGGFFFISSLRVTSTKRSYGLSNEELAELSDQHLRQSINPEVSMKLGDYYYFVESDLVTALKYYESARAAGQEGLDHNIATIQGILIQLNQHGTRNQPPKSNDSRQMDERVRGR